MTTISSELPAHLDPARRHDVVFFFSAHLSNPNGDPDDDNRPRVNPVTNQGLVTPESYKRKIRDYVLLTRPWMTATERDRNDIFVQSGVLFSQQLTDAYDALSLNASEQGLRLSPAEVESLMDAALPTPFTLHETGVTFDGTLDRRATEQLTRDLRERGVQDALVNRLLDLTRGRKPSKGTKLDNERKTMPYLQRRYFDIRMFGGVLIGENVSAGSTRGPVQFSLIESIDPVDIIEQTVTRVARHKADEKAGGMFGRRALVRFAVYRGHMFVSAPLAGSSGVTPNDLALLYDAMRQAFEHSRSSARPDLRFLRMVIFSHDHPLGRYPAHRLLDSVRVERHTDAPSALEDYTFVLPDPAALPAGVVMTVLE
ncbi:type I CRISPR-associated protein Cas7 [Deinococcus pimensis]|uniref:type I CRISPR-associated protein Cas7 n=1 Tax=Deinococcus pimensis TaxID=309888 RepID=UPI000484FBB3|nr:type I CRISPR-associated protein Cas7 [Deinococcus pimensis]